MLSWVAREARGVLESRIHSRCNWVSLHPDGGQRPRECNRQKFCSLGRLYFRISP